MTNTSVRTRAATSPSVGPVPAQQAQRAHRDRFRRPAPGQRRRAAPRRHRHAPGAPSDEAGVLEERVNHPLVDLGRDWHARGLQTLGVGKSLVDQRIVFGQCDPGRRHAREARCHQRRETPVVAVGVAAQVVREEPLDRLRVEQVPVAQPLMRLGVLARGQARVDQQLQHQPNALVARVDRARRGERAAGTVATHRDARRVDPEPDRFVDQPVQRVEGVVDRGRKRCSGASRYSTEYTRQSPSALSTRHSRSCVSIEPIVNPPP